MKTRAIGMLCLAAPLGAVAAGAFKSIAKLTRDDRFVVNTIGFPPGGGGAS